MRNTANDGSANRRSLLPLFLRALAEERGITQAEVFRRITQLPKHSGSRSSVNGWFTGSRNPGPAEIRALATALDVEADVLFAMQTAAELQLHGLSPLGVALGTWPRMISGHEKLLLVAGATMFPAMVNLLRRELAGTTVIVSTLRLDALAAYERELNGNRRETAFLRAAWLATADLLLDLAAANPGPRIRLWLRDSRAMVPDLPGIHLVANDWMMLAADESDTSMTVFGLPDWPKVKAAMRSMAEFDEMGDAQVAFDSAWPANDPRRRAFSRYCASVCRAVSSAVR